MPRNYTKMEQLSEAVFARKAAGETNREIAESYGLTLKQIRKSLKCFLMKLKQRQEHMILSLE